MKKVIICIGVAIFVLIAVICIKTFTYPFAKPVTTTQAAVNVPISELSVKRFSEGLRFATVSMQNYDEIDFKVFEEFRAFLEGAYPEIYSNTEHYLINGHSMVFRWKGKDSSLEPLLFLAHYDVVPPGDFNEEYSNEFQELSIAMSQTPVAPAAEVADKWEYGPFSGAVANGRIYGRGALDMKNMLFSILESADTLIKQGFVPQRDIYMSFGHDEEVGGMQGAKFVAEDFAKKGIRFDAVYDEGGIIAAGGSLGGLSSEIGLVGFAEKGYASYTIKVKGLGGHSSMPPLQGAMGKAAIIMQRLENNQIKQELITPIENFLKNVGGSMSFTSRMAIANRWLFNSMLMSSLEKTPATNALTRSTTALTMMKGSDANNILPPVAEFVVNFRILPGDTSQQVLEHIKKQCEGFDVEIVPVREPQEASKISSEDARGYQIIKQSLGRLFPEAIVSPYITVGGTDAIKYQELSDNIYRISPALLNLAEQRSIHNQNEYISIENFAKMIEHFKYIMANYDVK